jgi:hypothetical protein
MEAALKFGHQYDTTAAVEDGLDISDISDIPEPKFRYFSTSSPHSCYASWY